MRPDKEWIILAMALRGLCAQRMRTMLFSQHEDTFISGWNTLSPEVRAEWIAFAKLCCELPTWLDNLTIPRNTPNDNQD